MPSCSTETESYQKNQILELNLFTLNDNGDGCFLTDVTKKHREGKLVPLLTEAGAITNSSASL